MTQEPDIEAMIAQSMALTEAIALLLAGKPAGSQGAALADLLSRWVAGHYKGGAELMDSVLDNHIKFVRAMLPMHIRVLEGRKRDGH
jgi:hypothetical protein